MIGRRWILLAVAAIVILALTPIGATAAPGGRLMRWDLHQLVPGPTHTMPGLTNVSTVPAGQPFAGDTITVTGTGQFNITAGTASGGGTFVHRRADGTLVGEGVYVVTRFRSFQRVTPNGSLEGLGIVDTIGPIADARSGIARLRVKLIAADGSMAGRATLFVHCHLPGAPDIGEGIKLIVDGGPAFTTLTSGLTLFHILR